MKKVIIAVLVLVAIIATIPLWGGCDLNASLCSASCSIRHLNNDMKAAGCRAHCSMENASCRGAEAAKQVNDFMQGLQGH